MLHGVVIDEKCYTHGLILPTFDRDHPLASHLNCIELLKEHDPDFEDECRRAVICNMIYQHDLQSKELFEQVKSMPMALRDKLLTMPHIHKSSFSFVTFREHNTSERG